MNNFHNIFTQATDNPRRFLLPIAVGVFGLILVGYGLIALSSVRPASPVVTFEAGASASSPQSLELETIMVDVAGSVVHPGVYTVAKNARLQVALVAAGGLSQQADRAWVAKNINLASLLQDGQKIYVPATGEIAGQEVAGLQTERKVNINTASVQELDKLPGIGLVTAQKIINARPFAISQDLLQRKIVSQKVYDQIVPLIIAQ